MLLFAVGLMVGVLPADFNLLMLGVKFVRLATVVTPLHITLLVNIVGMLPLCGPLLIMVNTTYRISCCLPHIPANTLMTTLFCELAIFFVLLVCSTVQNTMVVGMVMS